MQLNKQEGFAGQVSVVLPDKIKKWITENPLISTLYVTDIGYYPKARYHFIERPKGAEEDILIYVVEGVGYVAIDNRKFTLRSNQFIVIPRAKQHYYMTDDKNPWTIYWMHVTGRGRIIFEGLFSKVTTIAPSDTSRIAERLRLFDEIIEILSLGYSPGNLEYANLCLLHLIASFKYIEQFRKVNYSTGKDIVKKAILYMKQHIDKKMSLEELAAHFEISVPHFSRLFRQRTRHSPIDYFIQLKMQYACQLLDYSNLRIHEVANATGYDDTYYFSRIFKKVMGVAPLHYKKS